MNSQTPMTQKSANQDLPSCAAMKVEAFLRWAGISRFLFYQEVKRGRIRPKKCGARTMIPVEEAERWGRAERSNFSKVIHQEPGFGGGWLRSECVVQDI